MIETETFTQKWLLKYICLSFSQKLYHLIFF